MTDLPSNPDLEFSVVVDNHPRFFCEFALWAECASKALSSPARVYFISCRPGSLVELAQHHGMEVHFREPLMPDSPHCNKFIPFLDERGGKHQVVADADLFFCRDPAALFDQNSIQLPPNNHAVPPLTVFEDLFRQAGLEHPPEPGVALFTGTVTRETYAGNVSAGLISVPGQHLAIVNEWIDTARWLEARKLSLGIYGGNIDQLAIALGCARTAAPFRFLPPQSNAVLELLPDIESLFALHLTSGHIPEFRRWFRRDGTLKARRVNPRLEPQLEAFNRKVLGVKSQLRKWPETRDFAANFLNPRWKR